MPFVRGCIDANQSTDSALRYANYIHSKAKTNIGICDIAPKFLPVGRTLKRIKPHIELFNFYGKHLDI